MRSELPNSIHRKRSDRHINKHHVKHETGVTKQQIAQESQAWKEWESFAKKRMQKRRGQKRKKKVKECKVEKDQRINENENRLPLQMNLQTNFVPLHLSKALWQKKKGCRPNQKRFPTDPREKG